MEPSFECRGAQSCSPATRASTSLLAARTGVVQFQIALPDNSRPVADKSRLADDAHLRGRKGFLRRHASDPKKDRIDAHCIFGQFYRHAKLSPAPIIIAQATV